MKKAKQNNLKVLEELVNSLLDNLLVKAEVKVSEDETGEILTVNINSENETGLLIGKRGETLFSLQYILGLMYKQKVGEWKRIIIDVGDYREKQEDYLKGLAQQTAERAIETGEPQTLYNLTPSQRRVIHMSLAEESGVITESQGEGRDRYLVVKKK
jgi:spoIIIJ-associated protein